jgi:hypothetical protein
MELNKSTPKVGETVYIEGREMIITQVRLDVTVAGSTGMIILSDPILYTKEKIEREEKVKSIVGQLEMQKVVIKAMDGGLIGE